MDDLESLLHIPVVDSWHHEHCLLEALLNLHGEVDGDHGVFDASDDGLHLEVHCLE